MGQAETKAQLVEEEAREVTPPPTKADWLSRFIKLAWNRFDVFARQANPKVPKEWLTIVSETLDVMECLERKQVKFVVSFLGSHARKWWKTIMAMLKPTSSSWEVF